MLKIKDVIFEEYQAPVSPLHHDAFLGDLLELLDEVEEEGGVKRLIEQVRGYEEASEDLSSLQSHTRWHLKRIKDHLVSDGEKNIERVLEEISELEDLL